MSTGSPDPTPQAQSLHPSHPAAPLLRVAKMLREFSVPLLAGVVLALAWANLEPSSYHTLIHAPLYKPMLGKVSLEFLVNEIFMALFFGIAAVEITVNLSRGGSLNPIRNAVAPLVATAGGVLGPVGLYFLLNHFFGGPELTRGWGIPTATDIALAWLVARFAFGAQHPAVSFLLLLAIADDAIGLAIIAIFYPDPLHPVAPMMLGLVAVGALIALGLRRAGVRRVLPYLLFAGVPSWLGLFWGHLHPALALVFIVPFMPHPGPAEPSASQQPAPGHASAHETGSTLLAFEHGWKGVVDFGLFFFGLANAGVEFAGVGVATGLVFASLLVGKTAGIFLFGIVAQFAGLPLPGGMTRRDLALVGMTAGIGLTVALFVSGAAFSDPVFQGEAKMGALASALIGPLVLLLARLTRPKA